MDSSREALKPDEPGLGDAPAKSQGKIALALGVIAIALSLVLGFVYLISVRRLEREVARLSQQTEGFSRLVVRAQEQSQTLAQQASQAAANAQAAAQQRDLAKQDQSNSEAQAQLARQQAAAEQQKADQATQQAEEYRKEREAQLEQLQEALGQIAETRRTAMGLVMTLDSKSIRFDFDKANIKPEYRDILNRIAGIFDCCLRIFGRHRHADVQLATLTASRRSCPRLLGADRNFPDDNHEQQGFWQSRPSRSGRQRTGACCQPPGRDRHSGFETYHERPSRRAKVN